MGTKEWKAEVAGLAAKLSAQYTVLLTKEQLF